MTVMEAAAAENRKTDAVFIRTPEGVAFSLNLAGPLSRFLAWLVDLGCISMLSVLAGVFIGLLQIVHKDMAMAFSILVYFIISIGYGMFTEWHWRGRTVGKRVLGLRVLDVQGLRLHPSQVIIRNLLRPVDSLPVFYLVGGIAMLLNRHAQRLGDLAANTIVVRQPDTAQPDISRILSDKYNSLRAYPHLVARLRQRTTPEEADMALEALLRRERLNADRRVALFSALAGYFKTVVPFPSEASYGMSDEQYIRNVVDLLFNRSRRKPAEE